MKMVSSARVLVGLACVGFASAGLSVASAQPEDAPSGPRCTVTLERTQPDDVFDVTRQIFEDGTCNCFVYTGSQQQSEATEGRVSRIIAERRCPDARAMRVSRGPGQGASPGAGSAAATSRPAMLSILLPATALFATGIVIAVDDPDSP